MKRSTSVIVCGLVISLAIGSGLVPAHGNHLGHSAVAAKKGEAPRPLTKFVITPAATAPLTRSRGNELAISPDGRRIVYVAESEGTSQLYVRSLDDLMARPIPGTEGASSNPFFSPDGESVAFVAADELKKVSLLGEAAMTLCEAPTYRGGSWGPGDTIVFAAAAAEAGVGLYRVSAAGGEPESLAIPDPEKGERGYGSPEILPGGEAVLFGMFSISQGRRRVQIAVLSLKTGEQKIVLDGGRQAHYAPTGHLVYARAGPLLAVPFDLARLEVTGDPAPILEGVRHTGTADYSLSGDGTLVYVPGVGADSSLVWVDRQGKSQPVAEEKRWFKHARLSPNGQHVALHVQEGGGSANVWLCEIARGILTPLTFEKDNSRPIWTPDGNRITFTSGRTGQYDIFWMPADGSSEAEQLTTSEHYSIPTSWSPDGKVLAFQERSAPRRGALHDIWLLPLEGERKPEPFLTTPYNEWHAMFSPDGRWIAFTSDRSSQDEVYVKRYPGEGEAVPISTEGGTQPVWARNGKELFYRNGDKMMVVSIQTEPTLRAETPRLLFEGEYSYSSPAWTSNYDVTPDGQRFLMIKESESPPPPPQINVILNWYQELKRLVPTGK